MALNSRGQFDPLRSSELSIATRSDQSSSPHRSFSHREKCGLGSGDGKATTRADEIVRAARYSQVATLFVSGDKHLWGAFDEARDRVVPHGTPKPGDIDLLDYAVVMTLRQGGRVCPVDQEALPPAVRAAAILRY
jgi:hypothetical protein